MPVQLLSPAVLTGQVLLAARRRQAALLADMVIGQSALLDPRTGQELGLSSSQDVSEMFVSFAKYCIRQEVLECLLNHTATEEKMPGLLSCCPNFASRAESGTTIGSWYAADDGLGRVLLGPHAAPPR